mmetsp:Transcript_23178/g.39229  ORF Transcript_23178/g.39229 Transcript_23178/m.39229 type:complete len:547 (+) Transcript_23178:110-1750(+)
MHREMVGSFCLQLLLIALMPSSSKACESGWSYNSQKCYMQLDSAMTWHSCEQSCSNLNATMLCIESANENSYVVSNVATRSSHWLGYNDLAVEGTWEWFEGCDSTYTRWNPGEPNNHVSWADCGYASTLSSSYAKWSDLACFYSLGCICEHPYNVPSSTPTISTMPTISAKPTTTPTHPTPQPTLNPTTTDEWSLSPTPMPTTGWGGSDCFPADAVVAVDNRGMVQMKDLDVGDRVKSVTTPGGKMIYAPVYFFGHRDATVLGDYITLTLAEQTELFPPPLSLPVNAKEERSMKSTTTLRLSQNHYAVVCVKNCDKASIAEGAHELQHVRAGRLRVGDVMLRSLPTLADVASEHEHYHSNSTVDIRMHTGPSVSATTPVLMGVVTIHDISYGREVGQYAPFVRGAQLIVDGVVVSPHASWLPEILDAWLGYEGMVSLFEGMYTPIYISYVLGGLHTHMWVLDAFNLEHGPSTENWWLLPTVLSGYYFFYVLIVKPVGAVSRCLLRLYAVDKRKGDGEGLCTASSSIDMLTVAIFVVGWSLMLGRVV